MNSVKHLAACLVLASLALCQLGCDNGGRPPLGYVTGTVKFEGNPVENIMVVMKPDEGRSASGVTNKDGYYTILYNVGIKGTKLGPTTVSLQWPHGFPPTFPLSEQYRADKTTLKLDVVSGNNTFDIDLEPESDAEAAIRKKKGDFIVD